MRGANIIFERNDFLMVKCIGSELEGGNDKRIQSFSCFVLQKLVFLRKSLIKSVELLIGQRVGMSGIY